MPRDDCLGFDEMNGRPPVAPGLREPRPKETVRRRQGKTGTAGSIHDGELVSERDDLQVQRGARLEEKSERVEQRDDNGRHGSTLSENVRNLNGHNVYSVFDRHRTPRSVAMVKSPARWTRSRSRWS